MIVETDRNSPAAIPVAGSSSPERTVHLAASLGGHLELLEALMPALQGVSRVWITSPGVRAEHLRACGERVLTLPRLDRSSLSPLAAVRSAGLALTERPKLIVASGAGLVVPFCAAGRAMGARLLFTETMARVSHGSLSGRAAARLGATMFVQWPELLKTYPGATLCRPPFLEGIEAVAPPGEGTFVTTGSHDQPFTRLLGIVSAAARADVLPRPIVIQDGTPGFGNDWSDEQHRFLTPEDFVARVSKSQVVITHGGAGAMTSALRAGRRPIVIPRLKRWSEHVDDHQLELVDKLAGMDLVVRGDQGISAATLASAGAPIAQRSLGAGPALVDAVAKGLFA
jgi:UDP-N-acetylglucosamine transferase subunit ALG13